MNISPTEYKASEAFSLQSPTFDYTYKGHPFIEYKRARVRSHILERIPSSGSILELNSGTGEDALFWGEKGFTVHATDISEGMQNQLIQKVKKLHLEDKISHEIISYTQLQNLENKGPYDLIFSNFAGLNCTNELDKVLNSFSELLKPGGKVVLVIMPPFCLWEFLSFLRGNFKTAFRRILHSKGTKAHIHGIYFTCWYYKPSFIIKTLKRDFNLIGLEGLNTLVPPSYFESLPYQYPKFYALLAKWEEKLKNKWPWKFIGDYFIISLQKKI